jgi:galactose-1-phosphate uridylyltransferase
MGRSTIQQINRQALHRILQAEDVETLSFPELVQLFRHEIELAERRPDGVYWLDPRDGTPVLFNASRARRSHDNRPRSQHDAEGAEPCVICQGKTTGVIDVADLSQGFTFINKNLYPVLYPWESEGSASPKKALAGGRPAFGLHFLQWTSSIHDKDWHNMPLADRVVVLKRLAVLEHKLLFDAHEYLPRTDGALGERDPSLNVLIFKNAGHLVGGSIAHGHQQVVLSNISSPRLSEDARFEQEHGETFSAYLWSENPHELQLRDYGPARLLVPFFMRRPFDMMLLIKDTHKQYLNQLDEVEVAAVAEGWHDAIRAMRWLLSDLGRQIAYNVIMHNGPGAGLYFEFLPYTQEYGGFEHLGIQPSQGDPRQAAAQLRNLLPS